MARVHFVMKVHVKMRGQLFETCKYVLEKLT